MRLGYLGRLSAEKDPLFLSELVAPLNRVFPGGWMIAIAGEGPMRAALQEALARSGSADRACWLGEIDGPGRLLEQVDFLCVPSRTEGQPLSVLEAMALGVVPVARRIPSLEELLGGDPAAGLLPPAEPNAWVEAIHDIWSAPGRLDDLRREGRRRVVSDHGIDTMVDRIEEIYLRGLMANRTG